MSLQAFAKKANVRDVNLLDESGNLLPNFGKIRVRSENGKKEKIWHA